MKTKRGFLLAEETLKIVIAVICVGFLAYFLTAIYFNNQDEKKIELAKSSLERLDESINSGISEVEIFNPESWSLMSWPRDYEEGFIFPTVKPNGMPKTCSNVEWASCLCICKNDNPDDCDDKGVCLENSKGLMTAEVIKIENLPLKLNLDYENRKISR